MLDADQTASESDTAPLTGTSVASDRDQATADRAHDADSELNPADEQAYDESRDERETRTIERLGNRTRQRRHARARPRPDGR